jgi:hypothetical protein
MTKSHEKIKIDEIISEYDEIYKNKPTKEVSDLLVLLRAAKDKIKNLF